MTLTFDQRVYHSLLTEVTPVAIETELEYQRLLKIAEQLTFKKNRTKEELALHKLLVVLIEAYETENCPIRHFCKSWFSSFIHLAILQCFL